MKKGSSIYDIEHFYANGDLAAALEDAAVFVKQIGERNVIHVIARLDETIAGAWWVDVIYMAQNN